MSNEPLRRTGSYAAATITAALVIWATTGSNVLQSLFLSMSYAVYRALRGHRWLTVHRKQLYQRLSLPPVVQRSPAAISCRLHLLPPPSAPAASLERSSGTCRTQASPSPSNNRGTIDRHVRAQQQQIVGTTRRQLATGGTTPSSSTPQRTTLPSTASSATTAQPPVKYETKTQPLSRRQRAKSSNNLANHRSNVSSSSSPSSLSPLAMYVSSGTEFDSEDNDTTNSTPSEAVMGGGFRQSSANRHRRSDNAESVARDSAT